MIKPGLPLSVLRGAMGPWPQALYFWKARWVPAPKKKKSKIAKKIFDFEQKKETRKKGINGPQISNYIEISIILQENIRIHSVLFYFMRFFFKTKTFQAHFCRK